MQSCLSRGKLTIPRTVPRYLSPIKFYCPIHVHYNMYMYLRLGQQVQVLPLEDNHPHRSIMYYRALSMQKMAGLPAAAGKAVQRYLEGDSRVSADGKGFPQVEDLDSMDKSVQKVFIKSPDYSVLESTEDARCAGGCLLGAVDLSTTMSDSLFFSLFELSPRVYHRQRRAIKEGGDMIMPKLGGSPVTGSHCPCFFDSQGSSGQGARKS